MTRGSLVWSVMLSIVPLGTGLRAADADAVQRGKQRC